MRFVLHSHDKTEGLRVVFAYSSASRLRLPDLRFSIRNGVRFQNEISYKNESFIWNENRSGMNPFGNGVIYGKKFPQGIMLTDAKKYMEME